MKRREFMGFGGAALLFPLAAWAGGPHQYKPGLVASLLAEGKTVFVDFYTDWCVTCRAQGRAIEALRRDNPAYDANIEFVRVDWDVFSDSKIARTYNIPRRSTLLLLRGDKELGRIVAGTSRKKIRKLLTKGIKPEA